MKYTTENCSIKLGIERKECKEQENFRKKRKKKWKCRMTAVTAYILCKSLKLEGASFTANQKKIREQREMAVSK